MNPTETMRALAEAIGKNVVGRPHAVRHALYALATGGHCLFEDVPGTAKTLLVRTLAQASGLGFRRVQCTPDLLPADILGTTLYDMKEQVFRLRKGPVFTQVLLADELNRAPPKTQAALLEAMQERQVTLDGKSHALPRPFVVFATQNPVESEGVYVLPEAELDRFMVRVSMGYPDEAEEVEVLRRLSAWKGEPKPLQPVVTPADLVALQEATAAVHVHDDLRHYIVRIVQATRRDPRVLLGSSPRGAIHLQSAARAAAVMAGRGHATDEDVKDAAPAVLCHRILMRPDALARGHTAAHVVHEVLGATPTPPVPRVRA